MIKITNYIGLTFLLLVLVGNVAQAQFKVQSVNDKQDGRTYSFPLLKDHSPAAKRINTLLWARWLHVLPEKYVKDPFKKIGLAKKAAQHGRTELNFKVWRNDKKVLSIEISSKNEESRVHEYHSFLNFDAQTGYKLSFFKLLKPKHRKQFAQKINDNRVKLIKAYLSTLDSTKYPKKYKALAECLRGMKDVTPWRDDIILYHDSVSLTHKSCGLTYHFQQNDIANLYRNVLTYKELRHYLTRYGKKLIHKKSKARMPKDYFTDHSLINRVYTGKINNKYPITFIVGGLWGLYTRSYYGFYFYDKYGYEIKFSGTHTDRHHLKFTVEKPKSTAGEVFAFKVTPDGNLKGTWTKGKKIYPIILK